jgi:ribonuclease Z
MALEIFVLGTGGMMPLPGRFLSSVLVRREGELFLFDCGEATQIALRRLNLKWKRISFIIITHTHADHVTGLPGILMLSSQVDRDEPLYIIGPPKIKEYIEANRRILEMYINYQIEVIEFQEQKTVFKGKDYSINAFPLIHSKICMGYTLEEDVRPGVFFPDKAQALGVPRGPLWSLLQSGKSITLNSGRVVKPEEVMGEKRKGRKISFIVDTLPKDGLADFVADSDLLICEAMFESDLIESATLKQHLTSKQAAELARAARVRSLGLIHYSPRYTNRELNKLLKEAKGIFPETFLTRDGQFISLPNVD